MKCYFFLQWHKHLDPIAMDTIRSRGLPVRHFTNSFFDFSWCYINILLLVAVHLFCYILNPICTFIVFYIFLPYSRPEFSSFFLIWYYIVFPSLDWLDCNSLFCRYWYTLFLYRFRMATFALIRCLISAAALLYLSFWLNTDDPILLSDFPFSTFLSSIFQWD